MRAFAFTVVLILIGGIALAAPQFPPLTGRVVDAAHVLSPDAVDTLDTMLADYERGTTNQVVVVTVPSLGGYEIEEYGYQLGRHWGIGQKGKNNGALLIVAPNERKVRIEVGYGLEPVLTDAISSEIVHGIILPAFRQGDLERGITEGTQAIVSVLGGKGLPARYHQRSNEEVGIGILPVLFWIFIIFILARRHPFLAGYLLANTSRFGSSRSSGWGSGGGGFRGGGGGFGGGGSSGSW